jgi:predicted TIM-barrel enzyme
VFATLPDALCVSGDTAGAETDRAALSVVKKAAGDVPVLVNTGVNLTNVADLLGVGDGAIVGTFFKDGGIFENMVDGKRVADLMSHVRELRSSHWEVAPSRPSSSFGTN